VLAEISRTTGETAAFYVREGDQRIVLYRVHSDRPIRHHLEEGAAMPLGRGAGGRVLTAFTDGIGRTRGEGAGRALLLLTAAA
jgi:DNA-binding IclR family transcriptional regulator